MFSPVLGWRRLDTTALYFQKLWHYPRNWLRKEMHLYSYRMLMWPAHWCQSHKRAQKSNRLLEDTVWLWRAKRQLQLIHTASNWIYPHRAQIHLPKIIDKLRSQNFRCTHGKQGEGFYDLKNGQKVHEKVSNKQSMNQNSFSQTNDIYIFRFFTLNLISLGSKIKDKKNDQAFEIF